MLEPTSESGLGCESRSGRQTCKPTAGSQFVPELASHRCDADTVRVAHARRPHIKVYSSEPAPGGAGEISGACRLPDLFRRLARNSDKLAPGGG